MELVTPGVGLIFWTGLIFLILLLLLRRFAFPPITKMLNEREHKIEEALQLAEKTRTEMEKMQRENEVLLNKACLEREKILKEAHDTENAIRQESLVKAKTEYERIVSAAAADIERERMSAMEKARVEIGNLALVMAEKVLRRELSHPQRQQELIEQDLKDIKG